MRKLATLFANFAAHHIPGAVTRIADGERRSYSIEANGITVTAASQSAAVKAWKRRAAKAAQGSAA